jgi:hypothetical protein
MSVQMAQRLKTKRLIERIGVKGRRKKWSLSFQPLGQLGASVNKGRSEGGAEQGLELAEWRLGGQPLAILKRELMEVKGNLKGEGGLVSGERPSVW